MANGVDGANPRRAGRLKIQYDLFTRQGTGDAYLQLGFPFRVVQDLVPVVDVAAEILHHTVAAPAFLAGMEYFDVIVPEDL